MTIHADHPFATPPGDRDQVRRFRGRMPSPVTVWTTGIQPDREGWTIQSLLVAPGEPPEVVGLVDEDSDFADALRDGADRVVVNLLGAGHRHLADAFARVGPAPGGPFTLGDWRDSAWGPVVANAVGWLGVRVVPLDETRLGWSLMVRGIVEHVELGEDAALGHLRGRYFGMG